MNIKEILIKEYPLTNKIECDLECYQIKKRRYVVFYDELFELSNIENVLNELDEKTNNLCKEWKTLIIVGKTNDSLKKDDLFYFNGISTFAVFYLQNQNTNKIYFNDSWVYTMGVNWKKIIRKFNEILK